MREHGIDIKEKAIQNKLKYDIPSLMVIKPGTKEQTVQSLQELFGIRPHSTAETSQEDYSVKKLTMQKPFDLQTAKRAKINEDIENIEDAELCAGKKRKRNENGTYEPLWKTIEKNF